MAAQTLSSPSKSRWNHDVFLSFRGEDTRKTFTDHLYTALVRAGIYTFRDEDELPRGKHISTDLLKAIRGSRISIVIFSQGYASSSWCLDELVEILHCKNTMGQTLLPIFYDLNPSDVRKQTGTFAEAFGRHEERFQVEMERVHKWRVALSEAANYSGWDLLNVANGYEARFIEKIVEEVLCKVNYVCLNIGVHPIGIDYRVEEIKALLNLGISDVHIVGIYGMGGIGKTTIAKALYNQICYGFEGSSCLLNIKEISEQPNGLVHLQEQFISDILKTKNLKIDNVDRGINLIKERFHHKRVLVVLDDVDHLKQLNSLSGNFEWFGPGSRVILTTRNEHLLSELGVYGKYKVKELNHEESLQLFSWHAFGMAHPIQDYLELSIGVVNYVRGLPLALEVLGSYLVGRSIAEWQSALKKLQKIPHYQIQKILRISFDSLDDDTVKDIFLDIACFFIGTDKEYAIKILDGCDFFPVIGINILIQKSLLTINDKNEFRMHDLIRDMGREIVREGSPNNPGKRSRLWFHEDVLNVLSKHTGSEAVEGLILNLPILDDVHLKTEAFAKMKNLRLLQVNGVYLKGCYEHLSKELRWLCWHKCPLKFLPPNFHLENLVVLDMQNSKVRQVWKEIKMVNKLKVLNLRNSKCLIKLPNFLQAPHLEMLILENCTSLVEVHESIGHLERLVLLNLKGCKKLRNLPRSISNLKSLETFNLSGCLQLDKLPEQLGNMMALTELLADRTAIKQLPSSLGLLKNLKTVSLFGCKGQSLKSWSSRFLSWISSKSLNPINLLPASISGLCSLRRLDLSECNLSEDGIPTDLGSLCSLEELDLSRNNLCILPHCISRLPKLTKLWLTECTSLQSISELPPSLTSLYASYCTSMERLSNLSKLKSPLSFFFDNCHKLVEIEGVESLESKAVIHMEKCYNLSYDFRKSLLQSLSKRGEYRAILLPGSDVPNWFSHQRVGSSISFHVPSLSNGEIHGLLVCAVYAEKKVCSRIHDPYPSTIRIGSRQNIFRPTVHVIPEIRKYHSCLSHIPFRKDQAEMASGEEIEVYIMAWEPIEVKKCGIHLLVDEPNIINKYGSVVQYIDSDTARDGKMVMVCDKRGRDDNEAGPSNDWSNEEICPKRSRMESDAQG